MITSITFGLCYLFIFFIKQEEEKNKFQVQAVLEMLSVTLASVLMMGSLKWYILFILSYVKSTACDILKSCLENSTYWNCLTHCTINMKK